MADTLDLGSSAERCAGSSPVPGTKFPFLKALILSNPSLSLGRVCIHTLSLRLDFESIRAFKKENSIFRNTSSLRAPRLSLGRVCIHTPSLRLDFESIRAFKKENSIFRNTSSLRAPRLSLGRGLAEFMAP